MGWKAEIELLKEVFNRSRNPLSLDMGWKGIAFVFVMIGYFVAIRFRWIWVGRPTK